MKVLKPTNQKSLYHTYANHYEIAMESKDLNNAIKALNGMNATIANEIKIAKVRGKDNIRSIELKDFTEYDQ